MLRPAARATVFRAATAHILCPSPPAYNPRMSARRCRHCKQWIKEGQPHDCWTTTEAALTEDLSADLRDAWERLRETAASFGDQRIYASHKSIMFSRRDHARMTNRMTCYFFVRPKRSFLELCIFLGRALKAQQVRRVDRASKSKFYHIIQIRHRDEVEPPITAWLREAYQFSAAPTSKLAPPHIKAKRKKPKSTSKARSANT